MLKLFRPKIKKPIIIGIHGLSNKPPKKCIKEWWKLSIAEGLEEYKLGIDDFHFEMVYWADLLYPQPLNPNEKDEKNPLFVEEPYLRSHETLVIKNSGFWNKISRGFTNLKEKLFLSKGGLVDYGVLFDFFVKRSFKDLHAYYNHNLSAEELLEDEPVRKKIRDRLRHVLHKHRNEKIMLIAHSMGSIIAYDVLYMLGRKEGIHTFITLGSPLGLPMIRKKFFEEHNMKFTLESKYKTPNNILKWYNFADEDDRVSIYHELKDEFSPNKSKVKPYDFMVHNDYKGWHTTNAHKSFGYLRTPEIARVIKDFLVVEKVTFWQRLIRWFKSSN